MNILAPQLTRISLDGRAMVRGVWTVALLAGLATVACGDLRDLMTLQQGLSREFPNNAININVSNASGYQLALQVRDAQRFIDCRRRKRTTVYRRSVLRSPTRSAAGSRNLRHGLQDCGRWGESW